MARDNDINSRKRQGRENVMRNLFFALIAIVLCCMGVVGFVAVLFLVLNTVLAPVVDRGDSFMTALKDQDYQAAYDQCSSTLQAELGSVENLQTMMQGIQPETWSYSTRSLRNGEGRLEGTVKLVDGREMDFTLRLDEEGDQWKISAFGFNFQ
jgi:hypothetical protein